MLLEKATILTAQNDLEQALKEKVESYKQTNPTVGTIPCESVKINTIDDNISHFPYRTKCMKR